MAWIFRLRDKGFDCRYPAADVLDADTGELLGEATSYTYGGTAWAVHTREFAGHVPFYGHPSISYVLPEVTGDEPEYFR